MNIYQMRSKPHRIERLKEFLDEGFVCVGFPGLGDLTSKDKEEIKDLLKSQYNISGHKLGNKLGQLNQFVNTVQSGDVVLIAERNHVHIGIVGSYKYVIEFDTVDEGKCHQRSITWVNRVLKSDLDIGIQNLIKNRNLICQYPGEIEDSGLKKYLNGPSILESDSSEKMEELLSKALSIIEAELESEDPERRLKAASELLRLRK